MTPNQIMAIIWLVLFFGFFLAEIFTVQFVSLWFMLGALVCLGLSFIPDFPIWAQAIVFFAVSLVSLFLFRPLMKRKFSPKSVGFNSDGFVGKHYPLRKGITPEEAGEIKIADILYSAKCSEAGLTLAAGTLVEVESIAGNTLYVKPLPKEEK
jgi:membrane protein implicated in regulation of membrane protease activity